MKTATVNEIKQQLKHSSPEEILELCLRLIKYKKDNKELVGYLLFDENDLPGFIENIKREIDQQFAEINHTNLYFVKKSLRKILKSTNKYIRYTLSKEAEVELLIYFCDTIKSSGIRINNSAALTNLYNNQVKKIKTVINTLHEDLQYDYNKQIAHL